MELNRRGHEDWMAEHNPEGWNTEQWKAFVVRSRADGAYSLRIERLRKERFEWVDTEMTRQISNRKISNSVRLQIRKDLLYQGRVKFPNPDPLEGWERPKQFKVGFEQIVEGIE
jgi:16S rRNA C967 or C1407 C5-methylase (RsmB/RsmF family)